ncbi:hypothetical protein Tco_1440302 [Tanacetum coccineum]
MSPDLVCREKDVQRTAISNSVGHYEFSGYAIWMTNALRGIYGPHESKLLKEEKLYAKFSNVILDPEEKRKRTFLIDKAELVAVPQILALPEGSVDFLWYTVMRSHKGESKVVADALSPVKERIEPLRVRALVMTIGLDLPKQILEAQIEAQKPENIINEDVGGVDTLYGDFKISDYVRSHSRIILSIPANALTCAQESSFSRTSKAIRITSTTQKYLSGKWDNINNGLYSPNFLGRHNVSKPSGHGYSYIDEFFLPTVGAPIRWVKVVPIKINIFAWKVSLDKLPSRLNLSLRGIDIPSIIFARWWELDIHEFHSYEDWLAWLISLRLYKGLKEVLEGVFYVMWWVIWKFRNQVLFGSSQPRLELLFDEIVLLSFT